MALPRPSAPLINLGFALLCLLWGSTWLVIKKGLEDLPPLGSAAMRFGIACALIAVVAQLLSRSEGGKKPTLGLTLVMGVFNFGLCYAPVYYAETRLPSGLTSVLWSVFPLMMAVSAHFFLPEEHIDLRKALGFLVGIGGVVLLFNTDVRKAGADAIPFALLLLVSPLCAAIGATIVKRFGAETSSLLLNRNGMFLGMLILGVPALLFEQHLEYRWTGQAIFSIVYLSAMGTAATFGLYFWLLRHAPAHKLSLIAFVTPVVALVLGAVFGGESLHLTTLGGGFLILLGVGLVIRR